MKITYDQEVDVLVIKLSSSKTVESDESKQGVILDYDEAGKVVRIEILDASKHGGNPATVEFELAKH